MATYLQELEMKKRSLKLKIKEKFEELKKNVEAFESIYSEINSLRIDIKAVDDRIHHFDKPIPYMLEVVEIPQKK